MASLPNNQFSFGAHWIVEGESFATIAAMFRRAEQKGFKGSLSAFTARVKRLQGKGRLTWNQLLKPLSERWKSLNESRARAITQRLDNDVIQAIANVERRKQAMSLK
jgi:hypothetical protein